jgi:hypothetical protein
VSPDELTPKDALELIYRLRTMLDVEILSNHGKPGQ